MKIVMTTETSLAAMVLKNQIIAAVKGEIKYITIDTWSYIKSRDNYDIVYHDLPQYVETPEKNVIFRVESEGNEVTFSTAWWKNKPEPQREILCLHIGRLTEMLLRYFSGTFIRFIVLDY